MLLRQLAVRDRLFVRRSPVFFGWFVVAAATVGMAMTIPGQTAGMSLFIDGFIAELGISRATISLTYMLATVTGSLVLPFVGRQIDRNGPRRTVLVVSALFGLACIYMSFVQGLATLAIGFVLMRGLGQGSLTLVSLQTVNLWFIRRRGRAIGIIGSGVAIAMAFFPVIVERMIAAFGWRHAFVVVGFTILAVMLPIGFLLYRPHPERFGLRPDGASAGAAASLPPDEHVATLSEARRTLLFWIVTGGGMTMATIGSGLVFHHFSIMAQNGLDRAQAAVMFVPFGLLTAAANLAVGFLLDRVPPRTVLGFMQIAFGLLILSVPFVGSVAAVWTYGAVFGLLQGTAGTISGSAYGHYFGRRHLGAIKGFANTMFVASSAFGPLIYGAGFTLLGSYSPAIFATATVPVGLGVVALFRGRRKK